MKQMTAALIKKNHKLLLVHNTKHNSLRIEPPGGKKEKNESLEECIIREVREEIGINVYPKKLFGVYKTNSPEGNFEVSMYECGIVSGRIILKEKHLGKITNYGWYDIYEIDGFRKQGVLVPNLCSAFEKLKEFLR